MTTPRTHEDKAHQDDKRQERLNPGQNEVEFARDRPGDKAKQPGSPDRK